MGDFLDHAITVLDLIFIGGAVGAYLISDRLWRKPKTEAKREAISFEEAQRLVRPVKGAVWQHREHAGIKLRIDKLREHPEFGYPEVVYTVLTDSQGDPRGMPGSSIMPLNGMQNDEAFLPGFLETFEPAYVVWGEDGSES